MVYLLLLCAQYKNMSKESKQYKKDKKWMNSGPAKHLQEKVGFGLKSGGLAVREMRNRFFVENSAILKEAAEEKHQLLLKRMAKCQCGKHKNFKYSECWECNVKRKNAFMNDKTPGTS